MQFHSTSQGDLPKVETLQLALKIGSKGARQQTEVLYGGATVSRENSMRATDRPSIEAGPRQTMFVTGKSLSSSRVLNFSGVNNRSSASRHNAESENVSVTLLSSRNKQANSSVLVSSGLRNTSQKQLGLLTRREPFIKGNSKKSKLKAKKQLRLEPHVLRKKPHTNSYISLHKKDSSTPAGLSASSSAENFSCLQGVGSKIAQPQPLSSKASACLEFLKERIRTQGKHAVIPAERPRRAPQDPQYKRGGAVCFQLALGKETQVERGMRTAQASRATSGSARWRYGAAGKEAATSEERPAVQNPLFLKNPAPPLEGQLDPRRSGSVMQNRLFSRKMNKENHEGLHAALAGQREAVINRGSMLCRVAEGVASQVQVGGSDGALRSDAGGVKEARRGSVGAGQRKYAMQHALGGGKARKRVLR